MTSVVASRVPPGTPAPAGVHPRRGSTRWCEWCNRELPEAGRVGRRRRYCSHACRQRAYESRRAVERGELPQDAVVLTIAERDDLADRLYQVRCAAEDVATALAESADRDELAAVVRALLENARAAERIR
ncbi:hypothetical protein [Nakamurella endophytica]|uniref:FCS-type domain-containing protein n=1 Tax=Nakamurella endophytica TaxID=1748367 RepID=A0A917SP17_9ACTN|nr:hypothetical protein [Nakamurella endophytica]GGL91552.1 hypothetical protein GCM10011594_09150 [Nakamurella endophytica]